LHALDLLSGEAQTFLSQVWARRVLIHKADPDELVAILSLDDTDALLTSTALRTPALRVAKDGKVLPSSSYTRQATIAGAPLTGLVDGRKVLQLFESGATLVLQGLHRYWPPLTRLIRELERSLGHPCQANAYLTPPGAQGFALHRDTHDVFVFQTHGAKQWEVHERGSAMDVLMEIGTSMYLPAGTPHAARTQESASLHVTVGINQVSYREALKRVVDRVLDDKAFEDRLPAGYLDDPGRLAEGLHKQLAELTEHLKGLDPELLAEKEITRFLTTRSPALRGGVADSLVVDTIDDESALVRRTGALCVVRPPSTPEPRVTLLLGDRKVFVPAWLEPACRRVADLEPDEVLRPADLAVWLDPQSRVVLARRLVREGLLRVAG
jgi:ribosomal protein L16 Arg81 hydroxylase